MKQDICELIDEDMQHHIVWLLAAIKFKLDSIVHVVDEDSDPGNQETNAKFVKIVANEADDILDYVIFDILEEQKANADNFSDLDPNSALKDVMKIREGSSRHTGRLRHRKTAGLKLVGQFHGFVHFVEDFGLQKELGERFGLHEEVDYDGTPIMDSDYYYCDLGLSDYEIINELIVNYLDDEGIKYYIVFNEEAETIELYKEEQNDK